MSICYLAVEALIRATGVVIDRWPSEFWGQEGLQVESGWLNGRREKL